MKLFLSILSVFIFGGSFWILKYFYPGAFNENYSNHESELNSFTDMRYSGYAIFGIICWLNTLIQYKNEKYHERIFILFFISFGVGLSISDIIDRFCFDITIFTKADMTMLTLNTITSLITCKVKSEEIKNSLKI